MTHALVLPFAMVISVCLVAAWVAQLRRRHVGAHWINLIPLLLVGVLGVLAVVSQTAGHVTVGSLALLAALIGLLLLNVVAALRSARRGGGVLADLAGESLPDWRVALPAIFFRIF
jgi:hypothetical protein